MGEHGEFLSAFLRAPFSTGSVAPSSRALAAAMIEGLELEHARTIVEVGPGTGAFTGAILEAAGEDSLVLAVEVNPDFVARLGREHPGLHVVHDSAEHLSRHLAQFGRDHADVVVCGLPWAAFPSDKQRCVLRGISEALRPGGRFVTFAYVHGAGLPWGRHFRWLLEGDFSEVRSSPVVWRNLPPAFVYRCSK